MIKDKRLRGGWAESVFIACAEEHGLPVSKPWNGSESFDCVVGRPGKFAAVQVKCTVAQLSNGKGYRCSVSSHSVAYRAGTFDFVACFVIPEEAWYIIPSKQIRGMKFISLCTEGSGGKYERYREAWHLLREATGCEEPVKTEDGVRDGDSANVTEAGPEPMPAGPAVVRMQNAFNFFRRQLERGGVDRQKIEE